MKLKLFIKKNHHLIIFFLFVILFFTAYRLSHLMDSHEFKISLIDDKIPLITVFVVPYILFLPLIFLPFLLSYKNKKMFKILSITFLVTVITMNILYLSFPSMVVRPEITGSDIFSRLVQIVYATDKPLNVFPSGHAAFILLANLCLLHINRKAAYLMVPMTLLIILSTVFVKQHYILDVIAGIIISLAIYALVFKTLLKTENKKNLGIR